MPMESGRRQGVVVAIECVAGGSRAEEWGPGSSEAVQTGDVVEELLIGVGGRGGPAAHAAPFKGGRAALQKLLHAAYKRGDTSVEVRVRRHAQGGGSGELAPAGAATAARMQACIVPQESVGGGGIGRSGRQYVLRSIRDPNYAVGLVDRMESECIAIRGSRSSRVVCALSKAQLQDGYVSYPWEKKMREVQPIPNSSSFLSLLILPTALDRAGSRYNSVEDTLSRANAWMLSSQASGVPIVFLNVQTEALLTKISGETASATVNAGSLADLPNLANASLYGFEDYHGVDIGVVKAVRVWYTAEAGEMPVEITLEESDARLGFAISRTEEGFIYVSSVMEDDGDLQVPSTRSGLRDLYREAKRASKLLVISRVSGQKVLPWMVSTSGAIRCFDTVSLSQKLSLHRHALKPILLHVIMWDGESEVPARPGREPCPLPLPLPSPAFAELPRQDSFAYAEQRVQTEGDPGIMNERDTAGDASFRFHNFSLPNNWV
ncbi:hypothetical protein PAHAL_1G372800 [Panicum hallii]|uniref:Uncharacterized protein n=1 Tax=Panicum hallii TaxID=206008 RepID=A0A2S3GSM8_9POAL|nr:uncharacterized protein LOC112890731 [Panicum hallii]PAN07918.1 hypothetical protein PAHAL_1G372800 [Panicum hallii]